MDFVDNNIQKVQVQPEDQVYARNEDIKVYGKLVSMSTENVVADSEQIWDKNLKKNQSDINSVTQSKFGEYLPLTGGDINGNLNVVGTIGINGTLTLGDSLHIEENNFDFEGANNESLTINSNGLTYAFTENQSQGFNVKEGDAHLNNITVIPKENNDTDRSVSYVSPGMITVDDGNNTAHFTPTSIELGLGDSNDETHVTAKTINTNKVFLTQKKAQGTVTVDTSITPNLIRLHQTPGRVTTIQPTGIISPMFQLVGGTDQNVLLGDGTTTGKLVKDIRVNQDNVDKKNTLLLMLQYIDGTALGTEFPAATKELAGLMTAADKTKLDDIENTYLSLSGGTLTGTLRLNDINSNENGLDINNVNGIQSVDQDKVSTPEVWTTNGNSIPLNIANGIAKLDQNGNIPLKNLGNIDTQIALVVDKLPTTDIKTNKIYLVRKNETGQNNAYIEYVYINNSWEKFGEYAPSIDLSEYSLKSQTVSSAAFVANSGNTQLQLTNANGSKSSIYVPIAETPGVSSSGQLTSGQNGFMSVSDKVKLNGIAESANNYVLKKATASDLGGIKIGFTANSSSKNYPVTLNSNDKAYVHVPWTDTQTDISNCVKNNEDGIINGDLTVNGNLSTSDADIVINSGKLELHSASDGIKFVDNEDSVYISTVNGSATEYFATDGSIQTIPNSYLPLSGGTVTGGITVDGAINTKSNITTDGTVTAKGFVSKTYNNNPHEVWACNGGSINLKTIIAATAVYVHGSIVESIAGSINPNTTIDDPDAIIFNKATGSFVAKKGNGHYKYWNTVDNLLINDYSKYGIFTANKGIVPYHNQLYRFANDNSNIYIANNTGSVPILDIYVN